MIRVSSPWIGNLVCLITPSKYLSDSRRNLKHMSYLSTILLDCMFKQHWWVWKYLQPGTSLFATVYLSFSFLKGLFQALILSMDVLSLSSLLIVCFIRKQLSVATEACEKTNRMTRFLSCEWRFSRPSERLHEITSVLYSKLWTRLHHKVHFFYFEWCIAPLGASQFTCILMASNISCRDISFI